MSDTPQSDTEPDSPEESAAIGAFLAIPIYALMIALMILSGIWSNIGSMGELAKNPHAWKLGALVFVCLAGLAVSALECVIKLRDDPFRAFAMGRYVFGVFLTFNLVLNVYGQWPTSMVQAPFSAVQDINTQSILLDARQVTGNQVGILDFFIFLLSVSFELIEEIAILLFLITGYAAVKGDRKDYDWDNFVHDITFGWKGEQYKEE